MRRMYLVLLAVSVYGCGTLSDKTADTREWLAVSCSGAVGWDACFKRASTLCPRGFDMANKEENLVTGLRSFSFACKK